MHDGLPEPGDVLADKYRVERSIGHGGMGSVFAVTHLHTEKRLALKCLLPKHRADPGSRARFMREARAVGRIQHRHVIDVFDVGTSDGVPFIVMPLLEGSTLTELLKDQALTLEQTLMIMVRAMDGVQAAHEIGIVHRDLKPCNIFVRVGISGRLDEPCVLDFGISKMADDGEGRLTRSGAAVGTPYYMALEQLTGRRDVDCRADIYAIGVILYEAIAGRPPHVADNAAALALELMHIQPQPLDSLRSDLPPGLSSVIMRALQRIPSERYQTMAEFIAALTPFLSASTLALPPAEGTPLRTPREQERAATDDPRGKTTARNADPLSATAYQERLAQSVASVGSPLAPGTSRKLAALAGAVGVFAGMTIWVARRTEVIDVAAAPGVVSSPPANGATNLPAAHLPRQRRESASDPTTVPAPVKETALVAEKRTVSSVRKSRARAAQPPRSATNREHSASAIDASVIPSPAPAIEPRLPDELTPEQF